MWHLITLCFIIGCMRPTKKALLPVLSGTTLPDIRHEFRIMSFATAAKENYHHLLHYRLSAATQVQQLRSRRPFSCHAARLLEDDFSPELAWDDCVSNGSPFKDSACPPPSTMLPSGADLPRMQWVWLNRLRSDTTRVAKTLSLGVCRTHQPVPVDVPLKRLQHVVVNCTTLKAPGSFSALHSPDD